MKKQKRTAPTTVLMRMQRRDSRSRSVSLSLSLSFSLSLSLSPYSLSLSPSSLSCYLSLYFSLIILPLLPVFLLFGEISASHTHLRGPRTASSLQREILEDDLYE